MNTKHNIILVDFVPNEEWTFPSILKTVTGLDWDVKYLKTNNLFSGFFAKLLRVLSYFLFPLSLIFKYDTYDKIIGWQQFYGLNYAFFLRLFHLRKINNLYILTFIYKRKKGLIGSIYHKYMNFIVTSKYIDKFICFSKDEVEYYSELFNVDIEKFVYIPLGINPVDNIENDDDGYIFATGRSNRNYDFLIDVLDICKKDAIIACDTYLNKNIKGNIRVLNDCHGDDMKRLMAKSHIVVIPLNDVNVSSGQLVMLQALSLGKPVICTASNGVKDYIVNNETGILVNNNIKEWIDAIENLYKDTGLYKKMSDNSKNFFVENFSAEVMYERIGKIVL